MARQNGIGLGSIAINVIVAVITFLIVEYRHSLLVPSIVLCSEAALPTPSVASPTPSVCAPCVCTPATPVVVPATAPVTFSSLALSHRPITDKVTAHHYEVMYDKYFTVDVQKRKGLRFLEIGLGCDMRYGPGASATLWPKLFPGASIWLAEYDAKCVDRYWNSTLLWRPLKGDQADPDTLKKWIDDSGGNFDYIIDDGGHKNFQIWTSFQYLFNTLKPGGVYFIEDLQIAWWWVNGGPGPGPSMPNVFVEWLRQMMAGPHRFDPNKNGGFQSWNYSLPDIERIDCVFEMCAVTKKHR